MKLEKQLRVPKSFRRIRALTVTLINAKICVILKYYNI